MVVEEPRTMLAVREPTCLTTYLVSVSATWSS